MSAAARAVVPAARQPAVRRQRPLADLLPVAHPLQEELLPAARLPAALAAQVLVVLPLAAQVLVVLPLAALPLAAVAQRP
jgi:hypothetical protein